MMKCRDCILFGNLYSGGFDTVGRFVGKSVRAVVFGRVTASHFQLELFVVVE